MATPSASASASADSVYTFRPGFPVYSLAWSARPDHPLRLAVGSFIETAKNRVRNRRARGRGRGRGNAGGHTLTPPTARSAGPGRGAASWQVVVAQQNIATGEFTRRVEIEHAFPPTKVAWTPDRNARFPDLLATVGDYLRLWEIGATGTSASLRGVLTNQVRARRDPSRQVRRCVPVPDGPSPECARVHARVRHARTQRNSATNRSDYSAPITSMDWNETDPTILATSSIDTTCTVWNVEVRARPVRQRPPAAPRAHPSLCPPSPAGPVRTLSHGTRRSKPRRN